MIAVDTFTEALRWGVWIVAALALSTVVALRVGRWMRPARPTRPGPVVVGGAVFRPCSQCKHRP